MDNSVFYQINYGVYIISSRKNEKLNGQIANTVFQITSNPKTIAISINKENYTHECIKDCKMFAISIVSQKADMPFIGLFGFKSGRNINKFENIQYIEDKKTGLPIVTQYCTGYLTLKLIKSIDMFTHTLFIGEVIDTFPLNNETPMTYSYYHNVKKGKSPKSAPTYIKNNDIDKNNKKEENKMKKYECTVCGYIYDPVKGDPDGDIAPNTPFENIPDDWVCPVCGVGKDEFKEME